MHKIFVLTILLILATACISGAGDLPQKNGVNVQNHATDAAKCLGLVTAGTVFKKKPTVAEVAGGVVDITGWFDIVFYPVADGRYATKQTVTVTTTGTTVLTCTDAAPCTPATAYTVPVVVPPGNYLCTSTDGGAAVCGRYGFPIRCR